MTTIGILKEIKNNENRVALTPEGVKELVSNHKVLVQKGAGIGTGFSDKEYREAGAEIIEEPIQIVKQSDIIVKVKEPLPEEYTIFDEFKGKTLFTYLHLAAADKQLTEKLLECNITSIGYETVEDEKGNLPLLKPMSQIAGVLAVQYGAEFLQKKYGGLGITLGKIDNAPSAEVMVIGGGNVGATSARTAAGMGANVTLFDINEEKIMELKAKYIHYDNLTILKSTPENLQEKIKKADLIIGAVLVAGAKAPIVITKEMVNLMKKKAVMMDVAIDQGGCMCVSKPTTHSNPIFDVDGKICCCITNMPGQVALQSTQALTNATLPYLLKMANKGVLETLKQDINFAKGLNTYNGKITYKAVADSLDLQDKYEEFC
jgi:alanine dehydrogenase